MERDDAELLTITVGPYDNKVYLLRDRATGRGLLIDAAFEPETILAAVGRTPLVGIVVTHGHMDHVQALPELRRRTGAPAMMHPADVARFGVAVDRTLEGGETLEVGRLAVRVLHTPGHTPGGLSLVCGRWLFSGDTLFPGGPGRTDSPAAFEEIERSVRDRLLVLPDDTVVYPGHGAPTTIGQARREYARFAARPRRPGLCGHVRWLEG
ncbi:MAG TPA: MBL fold metallo-hydrolase [Thermodesulfobacteriota bacterium]|nr:MBL fold metallo-hydrolase [Thermodesulfobacteriota bacterium]